MTDFEVIDTAPANHTYTGGLLCSLAEPGAAQTPDYLCGEFTWDGATRLLNWYHHDGSGWQRRRLLEDVGVAVGMAAADLTGTGSGDLVFCEWRLGARAEEADPGRLLWLEQPADPCADPWPLHALASGWEKTHDLHVGHVSGGGGVDVVARMKDERLSWFAAGEDPRTPWRETVVVDTQVGDGTAVYDVTGNGGADIVTATGIHENLTGDGSRWAFRPFAALADLQVDAETRVVAGDLLGDGSVCVAVAESEVLQNARLFLLHSDDGGRSWSLQTLVEAERDLGALHTLQLADLDGDGGRDLFVAEMELYRRDVDIVRRPTWRGFLHRGDLRFDEVVALDAGLGAHQGGAGRIADPTQADLVAKNWSADPTNACDGRNHVVHVRDWL